MNIVKNNGIERTGYLKKQIRGQDIVMSQMKKIVQQHAMIINEHAKFINTLIAENNELKRRLDKLEYKKPKLIVP